MAEFEEMVIGDVRLRRVEVSSYDWELFDQEIGPPFSQDVLSLPTSTPLYRIVEEG